MLIHCKACQATYRFPDTLINVELICTRCQAKVSYVREGEGPNQKESGAFADKTLPDGELAHTLCVDRQGSAADQDATADDKGEKEGTRFLTAAQIKGLADKARRMERTTSFISRAAKKPHESLHYVLGPGGVCLLSREKEHIIGRNESCDIHVDDPRVSRCHAKITWSSIHSGFLLVDLASANGTFVNNAQVQDHPLTNDDRIRVGEQILFYQSVSRTKGSDDSVRMLVDQKRRAKTTRMSPLFKVKKKNVFHGSLATTSVPEICQMLSLNGRDGRLMVINEDREMAYLYFAGGEIVAAEFEDLAGDEAALSTLKISVGVFGFDPDHLIPPKNVTQATKFLLMEQARLVDHDPDSAQSD